MKKILFVCMGNICRSPTAEAILKKKAKEKNLEKEIIARSCGTHNFHIGKVADFRSINTANRNNVELKFHRAQQINKQMIAAFDHILVMDYLNLKEVQNLADKKYFKKIELLMTYSSNYLEKEVPDPYYCGYKGFDIVFDMITNAIDGFIVQYFPNIKFIN